MEEPDLGMAAEASEPRGVAGPQDRLTPKQWTRFEAYAAEMFSALGMDLSTPSTRATPRRFIRAMYDSTKGYDGDPKILTVFPTECRGGADCKISQIIEGPIPFFALCEHHVLPFHGMAHVAYIAHEHI
ncbi:GTP cyclohydrolase I, partial [mine drainage metagenome]